MLNYTDLADQTMRDVVRRVREFSHIDPDRVSILAAARCTSRDTGNLANCCGLRNEPQPTFSIWTRNGERRIVAVSQWFQSVSPKVRIDGRPMAYLIQVRLPRMLQANPLETLIHEMYHIGEKFDGRMRPARHGKAYDREVRRLMRLWLVEARGELPRLSQLTFHQLLREFGAVIATGLPVEFKIPYIEEIKAPESYEKGALRLYPGHRLAANCPVKKIELGPGEPVRLLTEKDLVLRHYDKQGMRRLPGMFAPYAHASKAMIA